MNIYKSLTRIKTIAQWLFDFLTGSWFSSLSDRLRHRVGRKTTKFATLLYWLGFGASLFVTVYGVLVIYVYSPAQAQGQPPGWMNNLGQANFGTLGVTTERQCTPAIPQLSLDEPYCLQPGDTTGKLPVAIGNLIITGIGGQPLSVQRMLDLSGDPNSALGKLPFADGSFSKFVGSYKLSDVRIPDSWKSAFPQGIGTGRGGFLPRTFGEFASKVPSDWKIPDSFLKNPIAQTIPTNIQLPPMAPLDSFNGLVNGFTNKSFAELIPGIQLPTAMVGKMNFVGLKESSRGKAITGDVNGNIQSSDRSSDFMEMIAKGFPTVLIGNADKQKGNSCYGFLCSVKSVEGVNFNRLGETLAFQLGNFNKTGATARITTRICVHSWPVDLGCTSYDIFTFDLFRVKEGQSNFPVWNVAASSTTSTPSVPPTLVPSASPSSTPTISSASFNPASFMSNGQSITLPDSLANAKVPTNFSIQKMAASVLPIAQTLSPQTIDQAATLLKLQDSIQTVISGNPNISSGAAVSKIAENIAVGLAASGTNPATGYTAADIAQQIIASYSAQ